MSPKSYCNALTLCFVLVELALFCLILASAPHWSILAAVAVGLVALGVFVNKLLRRDLMDGVEW